MLSVVSESQKKIIRELVDQLIVNKGILPAQDIAFGIDYSQYAELSRLAFRYYKMIYSSTNPLDIDLNETNRGIPGQPTMPATARTCLGCGQPLPNDVPMPVCQPCRNQLKADYEVLKSLLD
jgi:hypothetical protein